MSMKGFTLIETMVAVTILTLAIAGPLVTANRAIVAARISRDQLTASYLAQEGIEYMRAVRDDNYLAVYPNGTSSAWNNFLASVSQCNATDDSTVACTLDPNSSPSVSSCLVGSSCAPLRLDGTFGYTQQSVGIATHFTRTVQVFIVSASDEKIVSKVSWDFHSTTYSVTIYDHLTPWQ